MAVRNPLVLVSGQQRELESGDTLPAAAIPAVVAWEVHAATSKTTPVDADEFGLVDSASSFSLRRLTFLSLKTTLLDWLLGRLREKLTAARTYYVRTDGSDSNTGLANTSGGAFLTIQKGIDTLCSLDLGLYDCTIQIADGTYTSGFTLKQIVSGGGLALVVGNTTTPANVLVSTTSANCIGGSDTGKWRVSGLKLQTTTTGYGVTVSGKATNLDLRNMAYGACANGHVVAASGAFIRFNAAWSISGSSPVHLLATDGSTIIAVGQTCTLTGTPALSTFASCSALSLMNLTSNTFSGSATGTRYALSTLSLINTSGGGATYLPGNSSGTNDGTGVYA